MENELSFMAVKKFTWKMPSENEGNCKNSILVEFKTKQTTNTFDQPPYSAGFPLWEFFSFLELFSIDHGYKTIYRVNCNFIPKSNKYVGICVLHLLWINLNATKQINLFTISEYFFFTRCM